MENAPKVKPGKWNLVVALPFFFAAWLLFVVLKSIESSRVETFQDWCLVALVWLSFLLPAGAVVTRVRYVLEGDLKWRRRAIVLEVLSILLVFPICLALMASRH